MRIFLKTLQLTKLKLKKENLKEIMDNKVLFSLLFGDSKNVPQEFSSTLKRSPIQVLVAINETAL